MSVTPTFCSALTRSEINPREPVDGAVHCVDLETGAYERIEGKGDVPQSRVGHVAGAINGTIYVFGGVSSRCIYVSSQLNISEEGQIWRR